MERSRRRITGAVAAAVAVLVTAAAVRGASDVAGEVLRIRNLAVPYAEGAFFVMPHERIALAVAGPSPRLFSIDTPQGALTAIAPNKWTWVAPTEKGRYPVEAKLPSVGKVMDFKAFVMVPATQVQDGWLNGFQIGGYPAKPLNGNPAYIPPPGFIEVTKDNEDTKVSPHFKLRQFLTKQKAGYPKYLVLDERLIYVLETIGKQLEPYGYSADDIYVMSGYRTPFYNKAIGDTTYSMHQWGRASDIFLDKNHDGMMDDFNKDKRVDRDDAVALANVIEELSRSAELSGFIGGIGIYAAGPGHGPFVHVDTRPWKARW